MSIDIIMAVMSVVLLGISFLQLVKMIKQINERHSQIKNIEIEYLSNINRISKQNTTEISIEELNVFIKVLKNVYKKMLQNKDSKNDSIIIVLRKYIEGNENFVPVYTSPPNMHKPLELCKKDLQDRNNLITYLYVNGNTPCNKTFYSQFGITNFKTCIFYTLKEKEKIVGAISIESISKVDERYSYENIKSLIENIENVLIRYIKNS